MWDQNFNWYHLRPSRSALTLQNFEGGGIILHWNFSQMAKWRWIEQNFVLRGIEKSWVGFQLAQLLTPNTLLTPKIWDLKTPLQILWLHMLPHKILFSEYIFTVSTESSLRECYRITMVPQCECSTIGIRLLGVVIEIQHYSLTFYASLLIMTSQLSLFSF